MLATVWLTCWLRSICCCFSWVTRLLKLLARPWPCWIRLARADGSDALFATFCQAEKYFVSWLESPVVDGSLTIDSTFDSASLRASQRPCVDICERTWPSRNVSRA